MSARARIRERVRRAFPYLVIAAVGFAIAYVVVFVFVLPSRIVTPKQSTYIPDTSLRPLSPGDSAVNPPPNPLSVAPPIGMYRPSSAPIPVDVPDLTGMPVADARNMLNTIGLEARVTYDTSSTAPEDVVLRQSPPYGAKVPDRSSIGLVISKPPTVSPLDTPASTVPGTPSGTSPSTAPPPSPSRSSRPLPPIQPGDPTDTMTPPPSARTQ